MLIIDNFIKDNDALVKDRDSFFEGTYNYDTVEEELTTINSWDWVSEPKDEKQKLIKYLLDNLPLDVKNIHTIEYWTHIHTVGCDLGWHTNKDELLREMSGKFVFPMFSMIYYPIDEPVDGGFLEISGVKESELFSNIDFGSAHVDRGSVNKVTSNLFLRFEREYERIKPKFNRLVIFNPAYLHRVTHTLKGTRYSIAVDVWDRELFKDKVGVKEHFAMHRNIIDEAAKRL